MRARHLGGGYFEPALTRASLFPDKIPADVAQDRLLRLQALQDELGARWLQQRVGDETTLLIENLSPKAGQGPEPSWQGRDPYGAPVHVELPHGADHTGRLVRVRVSQAKKHSLMAQRLGEPW